MANWMRGRVGRSVLGGAVVALALAVGFLVGLRSSTAAHHPHYEEGTASRFMGTTALFEGNDGMRVTFETEGIPWKSETAETDPEETPSCLRRRGAEAQVRVGLIEVRRPFGSGSYTQVLSVTCL